MPHTPEQIKAWEERPYSWSQHSSFAYDPAQWYDRYILGNKTPGNPAMDFGNRFSFEIEFGTPLAPIEVLPEVEYKIEAKLGKLLLVGYIDSYLPHTKLREYKTGKKAWTQKRVDEHGQLTFYCMLLNLVHKVEPTDLELVLQWIPTCEQPDFTFGFTKDKEGNATIHSFTTKRTMRQVLKLMKEIEATRAAMLEFIHTQEVARKSK